MKAVDLFCTSPASTAICTGATVYQPTIRHRDRSSIDQRLFHTHNLPRRPYQTLLPCSSQSMPISPQPYFEKSRSSSSSASKHLRNVDQRRKSSADIRDGGATRIGSARYLLSDVAFADLLPESERITALAPSLPPVAANPRRSLSISEPPASLSSSKSARSCDQVVVLKVSLHCRGCESKLKKHLAKIEGDLNITKEKSIY